MKHFLKKVNSKGFSLVEVICAVAILALVSGVIGSVIVISARTYRKGISETSVQQTAQLAANNISNIVKDAYMVVYGASGGVYYKNGEVKLDGDGNVEQNNHAYTELSLITNEDKQYTVIYDSTDERLLYLEADVSDVSSGAVDISTADKEIMAENVTSFSADTTGFKDNRTITLTMTVHDSSTGREIPMTYTMTSRNEAGEGNYVSMTDQTAVVFLEDNIVMVPGETYHIPVWVSGNLTNGIEWNTDAITYLTDAADGGLGAVNTSYAEVTIPKDIDESVDKVTISIRTRDKDETGNYLSTDTTDVYIRRPTKISVSHTIDTTNSTGGMLETAGTVYTFSAVVSGNNLSKFVAYNCDSDYKIAQSVAWSWTLTADGATATRDWTCAYNSTSGEYEFTYTDTNTALFNKYLTIDEGKTTENAVAPKLVLTVNETMPSDFYLEVTATSKHTWGYNKAASQYGNVYGTDSTSARDTLVADAEITLEPNEEGSVELDMKGGLTGTVNCTLNGNTDSNTKAFYNASDKKVYITPGNDEKGGENGCDLYTFEVIAVPQGKGTDTATITVHVSRIDVMSIEVKDNFTDKKGNDMATPTYDFRGRINVSNGSYSDMLDATDWLVDETLGAQRSYTLASRITCEMIDHEKGKTVATYQVICIAGTDKDGTGSSTKVLQEKNISDYFEVVNIKPARIEYDSNGAPYIKQVPEIDVSPLADTDTGLESDMELKVTMEMLHPLGTVDGTSYNKTGIAYGTAEAVASVKGDMTLEIPADYVIVELGQGTSDTAQSDEELVIPITVYGGGVYSMGVSISGNTSSGTKLSGYGSGNDSYGNSNPYMASTGTSSSERTWYLGLLIGDDEEGDDGLIDVTVTAYGTNKKQLSTLTFQLALRSVNKVSVKVKDNEAIADLNEEGKTVTLEAYPTGYGTDGIEYYAMQTDDDGNTCRWETENHGEYKTPYTMEWRMYYDGKEKALGEWTEYFSNISTAVSESSHKATTTFTLLQELPSGAKIRAYSLHALGTDGDTKYNKSSKEYGEVYGEISVETSLITVSGGWKRGGTVTVSYNVPEENLYTEYDESGNIINQYLVKDGVDWYNPNSIATRITFYSKYNSPATNSNITNNGGPWEFLNSYYNAGSIGGERGLTYMEGVTNVLTEYYATLYAWGDTNLGYTAYSSPYTDGTTNMWKDLSKIYIKTNIGADWVDATDSIAVGEEYYDVDDVVFQYTNALPATSSLSGDADGKWTNKNGSNTLVVYVTPNDTIDAYTSYYKLSEGWDEDYEEYTLLPSRYVGVINDDKEDDSKDERLTDFTVTNTSGTDSEAGRSYVSFEFDSDVKSEYVGKVVKMIYEYNPYLCNTSHWSYSSFDKDELNDIDGCEGVLEFHFVDANISEKSGVTMPEVRYCPTYAENSSSMTPSYYYISTDSRFYIKNDNTAEYQTGGVGNWTTQYAMTYADDVWTIQ